MSSKNNISINGISLAGFAHEKNIPCQDGNAFDYLMMNIF